MKRLIAGMIIAVVVITPLVPFNTASAATELIVNSGFETQGTAATNAANWTAYNGGYTRTNEAAHSGSFSAKATNANTSTLSGVYQRIDLNQTSLKPVFIGGYVKGNNITPASGSWYGASVYAEIHLTNGQIAYWNSVMNTGTFDWRWIGFNTGTLTSINAPISHIFVIPILAYSSGTAIFDDVIVKEFTPAKAAVTFMFDDGNATDISEGKKWLDPHGYKASTAVYSNRMIANDPTALTWAQLKSLQSAGWEIVSHSISHSDLTTLNSSAIDTELRNSKSALQNQGLTIKNFALPFGAYNGFIMAKARQYYTSARAFETGTNPQGAYPFEIKVIPILENTTASDITNIINQAKAQNRWVVLSFHEIAASGDDQYHIHPLKYRTIVNAVKSSGVQVVTYDQGLQMFGMTPHGSSF